MSEATSQLLAARPSERQRKVVIKVRGLRNQFGSHVVHDNLDLDIYQGDIVGVVGGSGTGKSVLLRSIVGLITPAAGEITIFDKTLSKLSKSERIEIDRKMGVLFQQGALYSSLTVKENIAFPLIEQLGMPRAQAEDLAIMKLFLVGLTAVAADRYPSELSGGMVKRAALARALALDPAILFLDEPTAGLDPIGAAKFDELIKTLRDALGLTIFLVTHDMDTLYTACDKIAVLSEKKVLISAPIEEVKKVDNEWIQEYFNGPRGRAAYTSHTPTR
ncbi:MAG: ATP-binding cassette domain-containing protein [Alcaligenaceae bacterium]|nr:ATP-binding cassette domain-containing protein [Alcaligenaceae bacterium]